MQKDRAKIGSEDHSGKDRNGYFDNIGPEYEMFRPFSNSITDLCDFTNLPGKNNSSKGQYPK